MHWEDKGGRVFSLSPSPSSEDPDLGGVHPPPFHRPTGGAPSLFPLSLSLCFLIGGMLRHTPCHICGQVDISRFATAAPKTLCMAVSAMKR
jgi:hypothetical protein